MGVTTKQVRKRYREKNKEAIAKVALPTQKEERKRLKEAGICYRCFKNPAIGSYCNDCLQRQRVNQARYRNKKGRANNADESS